ncbi:Gfo/Idh/MocA family protein [Rhizomicrobium electricum]|uniref:Gfo/Idh/MocA family oxidoreductase n=1 Tax=Rhizomicrobium electricum TaxID=480070 RepID=A0ABP3PUT4_9PROT|nr:Gfo/Idh/MocA family oxidoreductase [Rhizomicrobium electricum]NIJ49678.1 putative dehydrogenase [Rhizomicrobium electricum]
MTSRREVLGGAAAATFLSSGWSAYAAPKPWRVGLIGSAWMGRCNLFALMQVAPVDVVALCDVDRLMLADMAARIAAFPDSMVRQTRKPEFYGDYRQMLKKHQFDIVIVATPDHWHALPAIAALKAGAHVYLEKPVTVDVAEGKAVLEAARAANRVVQVGTQRRASPPHIEARDRIVKEGRLGKIGHVELYGLYHQRQASFPPVTIPPKTLDWNTYVGPAPFVDYRPNIHPINWRSFREFGNGYIADLGVHFMDTVRWMLDLRWPKRISSVGGTYVDKNSPATVVDTQTAQWEFDDLLMSWTNREWAEIPDGPAGAWGAKLYGDKGTLTLGSVNYEFVPVGGGDKLSGDLTAEMKKFPNDAKLLPMDRQLVPLTRPNMRDFIAAIEQKRRPVADIEEGYISTSSVILANMAMDLGRPIRWDGKAERVIGDEEAQRRLARPYRGPWKHPALV